MVLDGARNCIIKLSSSSFNTAFIIIIIIIIIKKGQQCKAGRQ